MSWKWEYQLQHYTPITSILSEARQVVRASLCTNFFCIISCSISLFWVKETSTSGSTNVNYNEVKEITQGEKENTVLFYNRLVEAFQKYTNIDSSSPESQVLIGQYFITQSAPDIHKKLQQLQRGHQAPLAQLMDVAFSVFISWDLEERQAKLLALVISGNIGYSQLPQGNFEAWRAQGSNLL